MSRRLVVAQVLLGAAVLAVPAMAQEAASPEEPAPAKPAPEAATPRPSLERLVICTSVDEDRVPVGEGDRFPGDVGRLWCFTKVVGADPPTRIFHRWYIGDRLMDEIPIPVNGTSWRCWSNKGVLPEWSGPGRVEVLTEAGEVLGTREFTLTAAFADSTES